MATQSKTLEVRQIKNLLLENSNDGPFTFGILLARLEDKGFDVEKAETRREIFLAINELYCEGLITIQELFYSECNDSFRLIMPRFRLTKSPK